MILKEKRVHCMDGSGRDVVRMVARELSQEDVNIWGIEACVELNSFLRSRGLSFSQYLVHIPD